MNIIGIDISLNSTAICITNDDIKILSFLNELKGSKWSKELNTIKNVKINPIKYNLEKNYSDKEISKLESYDKLSENIINELINICGNDFYEIRIEGYSFSKQTSSLADIIALSTLIRLKLLRKLNCKIKIVAPSTLKKETCVLAYGYKTIKKYHKKTGKELKNEIILTDDNGISGGKFTKFEMYKSLLKINEQNEYTNFLNYYSDKILEMKKIPSPIDDINDSILLTKIKI
jgi:hypothetical protein